MGFRLTGPIMLKSVNSRAFSIRALLESSSGALIKVARPAIVQVSPSIRLVSRFRPRLSLFTPNSCRIIPYSVEMGWWVTNSMPGSV